MPAPVPNFAHLSHRWTEGDARLVLAALDASGLRPCEFARRSGVHVKRLWSWRRRLGQPRSGVRSPTPPAQAARLVELVAAPACLEPAAARCVEVVTPTGWQIRVPGEQLSDLVHALSRSSC